MAITNVERPIILIKCGEKRWIDEMYKGNMRFSGPGKWVEYELKNGIGRGDKFEGTFAINNSKDTKSYLKKKYGNNLIINDSDEITYYQLHTTLGCPTFCMYTIEDKDITFLEDINAEGIYDAQVNISGQFYQDFAKSNGLTDEDIANLPEDQQPALLIMANENVDIFLDRLGNTLKADYGLCDSNILMKRVNYEYSRSETEDYQCRNNHSQELFFKNEELEYQKEVRVVINSKKHRFKNPNTEYLDVHIDGMKKICEVHEGYTPEGTTLKMKIQVSTIKHILERDGKIKTGYMGKEIKVEGNE